MMRQKEEQGANVFLGMEVIAPWPYHFPNGRLIPESARHFTLAFLGPIDIGALLEHIPFLPKLKIPLGFCGVLPEVLFLPERHPHVVAYGVHIFHHEPQLLRYQHECVEWLNTIGFPPAHPERAWLNHVTIARAPFDEKGWRREFKPLPFISHRLHVYRSTGNLHYEPQWSYVLTPPFEEIPHTADVAYLIRGENFAMLKSHAEVALSFRFPNLFEYFDEYRGLDRVEQLVQHLNRGVAKADAKEGVGVKSVSMSGEVEERGGVLEWRMIVDV